MREDDGLKKFDYFKRYFPEVIGYLDENREMIDDEAYEQAKDGYWGGHPDEVKEANELDSY